MTRISGLSRLAFSLFLSASLAVMSPSPAHAVDGDGGGGGGGSSGGAATSGGGAGGSSAKIDVDRTMFLARADIDAGNYESAIKKLQAVVSVSGRNADAYNLLGYSTRKIGRLKLAARYYKLALKMDPNHLGALEYQGELFLAQNNVPAAQANLAKLQKLCGVRCEEYLDLKKEVDEHAASS